MYQLSRHSMLSLRCGLLLLALAALSAAGSTAWAQFGGIYTPASPYDYEVDVEYFPSGAEMLLSSGGAMSGEMPEEPLTPEQQAALESVQAYMAMESIGRSPSTILRKLAEANRPKSPDEAAPPSVENPAEPDNAVDTEGVPPEVAAQIAQQAQQQIKVAELQAQLVRGDWTAVKEHLATLPELASPFVYSHILRLLVQSNSIRPEEIPAIAEAAPGQLTPKLLSELGMLVRASLAHADQPRAMLATIAAGTERLGGASPAGRMNAARLLLAAGLLDEAKKYVEYPENPSAETPFDLLDLCSLLELTKFEQNHEPTALAKAWQFTVVAWHAEAATQPQRTEVLRRLIVLLPQLPKEQGQFWIAQLAVADESETLGLVANMLQQAETAYASRDPSARTAIVKSAATIGDTLSLTVDITSGNWQQAVQWLAIPWLNEALKANGESKRLLSAPDDNEIAALPEETLAQSAPSAAWMAQLPADTAAMAQRLKGSFAAKRAEWEAVRQSVAELASYDEQAARNVIDLYLSFAIRGGPQLDDQLNEIMQQYQGYGYGAAQLAQIRQQYMQQLMYQNNEEGGEGVALTRARQVQSLKKLKELLDSLAAAKLPQPSAKALAEAFTAAHSSAEVFRQEDLEIVFGPLEELPLETAAALGQKMREHLAGQWRDQRVQDMAGTKRTEVELAQEVVRGYELAIEMIRANLVEHPEHVRLHLLTGLLLFDQSEYLYGLGTDLPTYVQLRDRAFGEIEQAAQQYAAALPKGTEVPSIEVYLRWFQVALGASDLAYLTRQATAERPQIAKLAAAIRSLGEAADVHLKLFGEGLDAELDNVPPPLKQRCLEEALVVLGDHPAGDKARQLREYYQQLLEEVDLHTEVDGSRQVGHGRAFGLRLSVRYSTPLGREGGNFVTLIDKQYDPMGNQVDNKEKLDEEIRAKLSENFEIQEIRFHQPTVKPLDYGRAGWRETPLAYVVLSAKDPAVDTIAPLQIDVPFRDGHGTVLLPIASQKLLIDARDKSPPPRPLADLAVKQLLDNRGLAAGDLRLELVAAGKGLVPELKQIAALEMGSEVSGFRVTEIEDHGIALTQLDTEQGAVQPLSERTWIVSLQLADRQAVAVVDQFIFPEIIAPNATVTYEQYADADIVAAERTVALQPLFAYNRTRMVLYGIVGAAAVLILLVGLVWLARRKQTAQERPTYSVPEQLTPFSLVAFLRRVATDHRLKLAPADRETLTATIADLEARYFTAQHAASEPAELHTLFNRWNAKAQQHFAGSNGHR